MSRTVTPLNIEGPENPDEGLRRLLHLTRETLNDQSWPASEVELRRLQDRVESVRPQVRWSMVAAFAAAMALLPVAWMLLRRPSPLTFEVIHGTIAAGGEIRPIEPIDTGTRIQFSEGSEVVLDQEARTQVRDLTAVGGRIVLTHGRAHTFFVPRPHARWQVTAGPYTVQVTGTVFDVEWSEENQALDVWLHKGSVTVHGPLIGGGVIMTHGQHLLTRIRDNRIVLDSPPAADMPPVSSSTSAALEEDDVTRGSHRAGAEPDEAPAGSADLETARGETRHAGLPQHAWARHLARGDFEAVVAAAERRGVGTVLARGSRHELGALADAARYTRRGGLARRALYAERTRFPGTSEGREAAYFLGNLAEDEGTPRMAVTWFSRYLQENPSGTYASQALGRTMIIHNAEQQTALARTDAQEYLRRYPTGSYAEAARRIIKAQ